MGLAWNGIFGMAIKWLSRFRPFNHKHWKIHSNPKLQELKRTKSIGYVLICFHPLQKHKDRFVKRGQEQNPYCLRLTQFEQRIMEGIFRDNGFCRKTNKILTELEQEKSFVFYVINNVYFLHVSRDEIGVAIGGSIERTP